MGQFPMHFGSIRDMSTDCDYRQFIHALTSFDYALSGHATLGGGHEYNKLDRSIIRALIKQSIGDESNSVIPEYINQTFLAFCKARKFVNIIKPRLDRKGIMEKLLFQKDNDRMIRFELFFVFKELESITVEYDSIFRPTVDVKTLNMIREGLVTVNERINGMEEGIQESPSPQVEMTLKKVKLEEGVLKRSVRKFKKAGWKLECSETKIKDLYIKCPQRERALKKARKSEMNILKLKH